MENPSEELKPNIELDEFQPSQDAETRLEELWGMIPTEDKVPTYKAARFLQQFRFVRGGGSSALYAYDSPNDTWLGLKASASIPAAPLMPLYGSENELANTYLYTFAYTPDWSYLIMPAGSGAGIAQVFANFGSDKQAPFLQFTSPSITPVATIIHSCYFTGTSNFLMASEAATPTVYKYDANSTLGNETALTISGTTIANCLGLTADSTYIYIMVTTTTVKRFTLASSTLTYVDTLTLGNTTERYLAVDDNYIYSMDATNTKYYLFNKITGATITSYSVPNLTTSNFRGMCIDPDGKLRQFMSSRVVGSTTTNQWYISRLSLA